ARRLLPGDAAFRQCAQHSVLPHHRAETRPAFLSGDGIPLLDGEVESCKAETKRAPQAAPFSFCRKIYCADAARCGVLLAQGPTSGWPCVLASLPSSAATPLAMAPVSLPAWKQVKSGRSTQANGPHSRTPALMAASCTMLISRS